MGWLTLLWSMLRRVNWRVYAMLAFACAVAAALLYARHHWIAEGRAEIQGQWDAAIERGRLEIARLDRENAAREATALAEAQSIGESRNRDLQDQLASEKRLVSDLRSGNIRLRQHWQGCVSQAAADGAAAVPGGSVPADQLRSESAGRIIAAADDADSKVKRLVEFVQVQHKLCEEVR